MESHGWLHLPHSIDRATDVVGGAHKHAIAPKARAGRGSLSAYVMAYCRLQYRYDEQRCDRAELPPPPAFPPWPPSGPGRSGEWLRPAPTAHINQPPPSHSDESTTVLDPPIHARFPLHAPLGCFVLLQGSASSSKHGVPNARRCHGQVSSLAPCGPLEHSRMLTAYSSGTGYSKLGTMRRRRCHPGP